MHTKNEHTSFMDEVAEEDAIYRSEKMMIEKDRSFL